MTQVDRFFRFLKFFFCAFVLSGCSLMGGKKEPNPPPVAPQPPKSSAPSGQLDESAPRKRLMILPFLDDGSSRPQKVRDAARADFIKELNRQNQLIVVDSSDLSLDLSRYLKNQEYNLSEISKEANNMGVAAVLEGKILELKVRQNADEVGLFRQMKTTFECKVRVRIASSRSGKDLFNTIKTVSIEESNLRVAEAVDSDRFFQTNPEILEDLLKEAFLDFTPQINETMAKLSWEGRVAMITGDRIFLNVGRISGVQIGDILKVSEEGEEVYDPQSGNYIGRVPGRLKGTLEVISFFGQDGSIAVVHSGSGFKENDKVELY